MDWRGYFLNQHMDWTKKWYKTTNTFGVQVETGHFQRPKMWNYRCHGIPQSGLTPHHVPHRPIRSASYRRRDRFVAFFVLSFASNKLLMLVFASSYIVLEHQENDLQRNFMEIKFVFTPRINNQMDLDFG